MKLKDFIKLFLDLFDSNEKIDNMGIPRYREDKNQLWKIDKDKISEKEYIRLTQKEYKEKKNWFYNCQECARERYRMNTGWAQFCKKDAPTLYLGSSAGEYQARTGISINQIKSNEANINIIEGNPF